MECHLLRARRLDDPAPPFFLRFGHPVPLSRSLTASRPCGIARAGWINSAGIHSRPRRPNGDRHDARVSGPSEEGDAILIVVPERVAAVLVLQHVHAVMRAATHADR